MENMNVIVQIIGQIGFPIVCCLILMWFCKYLVDNNKQSIEKLGTDNNDTLDKMTTAIENNTKVITELLAKFEVLNSKVGDK